MSDVPPAEPDVGAQMGAAAGADNDGPGVSKNVGCGIVIAVIIGIIAVASVIGGSGDDEPSGDDLRYGAFDVCTQFVKDRLKAPGTASFPNQFEDDGEVTITGGPTTYTVVSHVDAQNSFGGEVRTRFVCEVRHVSGERWQLVDLTMS